MIRLDLKKKPYWLDIAGSVRLYVRPLTTAIMSAAQNASMKEIAALDPVEDDSSRFGLHESMLIKKLACLAIVEWEGVMLPDSNDLAPINDVTVADLMDIWFIAQKFWSKYSEDILRLEEEGNGSGPELSGTSAAGPHTAKVANHKK